MYKGITLVFIPFQLLALLLRVDTGDDDDDAGDGDGLSFVGSLI